MEELEAILAQAEEADAPPPEPFGGIPKQWLPGWIRWPIRLLLLPWILLDLYCQKLALKILKPPFKRVGTCKQRGNCCHFILTSEDKGFLGKLYFFFNTQINGFYLRYKESYEFDGDRVLVMGCRYLKKDGGCGHYRLRPTICRKWPIIEHFGRPRTLKGCGFRAIPKTPKKSPLDILK